MTGPVILVVGSGQGAVEASREIVAQGGRAVLARSGTARRQCALRTPGGIDIVDGQLISIDGRAGSFRAKLLDDGEIVTVECSAVILAPGPDERHTADGAMSLDELEEQGGPIDVRMAAFVLLPGSPRGSFIRAVRAARALRSRPAAVTVFADEMLAIGTDEIEYRQAQIEGVVFVRTADACVTYRPRSVRAGDQVTGTVVDVAPDLLVVETPNSWTVDEARVSSRYGIPRGPPSLGVTATAVEGIFFAGRGDQLLDPEEITAARAAATRAMSMALAPPDRAAQAVTVDRDRCSACLTCFRICPHGAARPGEEGKASIDGGLCQACGICVGACPGRVLSLPIHSEYTGGAIPMEGKG